MMKFFNALSCHVHTWTWHFNGNDLKRIFRTCAQQNVQNISRGMECEGFVRAKES